MAREYWEYLKLDRLLSLQGGYGDQVSADELHFIVVHQSFELWFKLLTSELRLARNWMGRENVADKDLRYVVHHLRRVVEIMKLAVATFDVMETLTPQDFLEFRDKFAHGASGLQSHQLRVIETLMGLGIEERQRVFALRARPGETVRDPVREIAEQTDPSSNASASSAFVHREITQALSEQTFLAALQKWLARTPVDRTQADRFGPEHADADARSRAYAEAYVAQIDQSLEQNPYMDAARKRTAVESARAWLLDVGDEQRRARTAILFIESNRELALLSWARLLLDVVVEMEEQLLLWRMRHARMTERIIGRRVGTGGTPGDYLDSTLQYRIFSDLWDVRQLILPRRLLPALRDRAFYESADFAYPNH